MKKEATGYKFEEFCNVIDGFAPCMDDYLYCYDLAQDLYHISESALQRFDIPTNHFSNVMMTLRNFIYEDDVVMLIADLEKWLMVKKMSTISNIVGLERMEIQSGLTVVAVSSKMKMVLQGI